MMGQVLTILTVFVGTQITRWLPFWFFRSDKPTPRYVKYLGQVLPPAIFGMLVVYCYKDVEFGSPDYGMKELICGALVAVVQLLFKNMCLSIVIGTIAYILWVNI